MKRRGFLQALLGTAAIPAAIKAAEAVEAIPALPDPRTEHQDYFEQYAEDGQMVARGVVGEWFTAMAYVSPKLRIR